MSSGSRKDDVNWSLGEIQSTILGYVLFENDERCKRCWRGYKSQVNLSMFLLSTQVVNTLSASAPGGASIIFGKATSTPAPSGDTAYPFNHSSMGAFLESCRGARVTITLDSKISKTGMLLMVERAQRVIEGAKEKTEEYFASIHIFEEGSIRKIPFPNVVEVSLVDATMQEQLSKNLFSTLEKQLPKPLPPPKDNREVISIRAKTSESSGPCHVSYVDT